MDIPKKDPKTNLSNSVPQWDTSHQELKMPKHYNRVVDIKIPEIKSIQYEDTFYYQLAKDLTEHAEEQARKNTRFARWSLLLSVIATAAAIAAVVIALK